MSPVVLGIDTSGFWCSAALLHGTDCRVRRAEVGSAHSNHLLAMIEAVLGDAAVTLVDCDAIAFSVGPGSFTGLRVGCAVAQGLAFGSSLRIAPVGTLSAIAHSVAAIDPTEPSRILVAQDARMGEIYWTLIERAGSWSRTIVETTLASPQAMCDALEVHRPIGIGCGNAWTLHGALLDGLVGRVVTRQAADAVEVAQLGVIAVREDRLVKAELASPVYVRNDVARTTVQREALARDRLQAAAPGAARLS